MTVQVAEFHGSPEEWDDFVRTQAVARFSHHYEWVQLIQSVYGGTPYYLAAYSEGEIVGVAPLMLRKVLGEGAVFYATAFADEGGICADDAEVANALLDEAVRVGERRGASYLEVRQRRPIEGDYPCDETRAILEMPLTSDADQLWDDLSKNMRKKVRRALRDGLVCEECGPEGLRAFYDIYAANMQELGSPMHSRRFFRGLFDRFSEDMLCMLVRLPDEAQIVGAAVAIRFRDILTVLCAHSLREYFDLFPNNLLYWRLFEAGIERDCRVANFGRSPRDSGIYRFKKSWHMEDHQLYYTKIPICSKPQLADGRESGTYELFRRVWPRVPRPIARAIGPRIWARLPI